MHQVPKPTPFILVPELAPSGRLWFQTYLTSALVKTGQSRPVAFMPSGFRTDFLSLPGPFKYLSLTAHPKYRTGAAFHDYLYQFPGSLTRKEIDNIMWELWIADGAKRPVAGLLWFLVRTFSGGRWRDRRAQDK